ncbi:MAG: hypothetical protein JWR05_3544 [Mucilaginibacter sp.]|nr:hypothetical protein [Mucilaginibacter sp.]
MKKLLVLIVLTISILSNVQGQTIMQFSAANPGTSHLDSIRYFYSGKYDGFDWLYNAFTIRSLFLKKTDAASTYVPFTESPNDVNLGPHSLTANGGINTTGQIIAGNNITGGQLFSNASVFTNTLVLRPNSATTHGIQFLPATNTGTNDYNIQVRGLAGTMALTSDIPSSLPTTNALTFDYGLTPTGSFNGSSAYTIKADTSLLATKLGLNPAIGSYGNAHYGLLGNPLSQFASTSSAQLRSVLLDETGTGLAYFQNGDLGTPSTGIATNLTGTASALTAGNVITNANLTGPVVSVGNATSLSRNIALNGITPSAWQATRNTIELFTGVGMMTNAAGNFSLFNNFYYNSSANPIATGNSESSQFILHKGDIEYLHASSATTGSIITLTSKFKVDSTGVVIGNWKAAPIDDAYISSAATWNAKQSAIAFGTGVQSALGVNIGSAGSPVLFNGAGGTPSSITLTNAIGTAASLTAGSVTTNANLTGPITSVGNATSVASQTGTGSKFVMDTSPTLITPTSDYLTITGLINSAPTPTGANIVIGHPVGSNAFSFKGSNTFSASFSANSITATRSFTLPDINATLATINGGQTFTSATWNATKIGEIYGGTNQSSYAVGDMLYGSAVNTLSKVGIGSTNDILTVIGGIPTWTNSPIFTNLSVANFYTTSAAPTVTLSSTITSGTGATITVTGNNTSGIITLVTGTGITGNGALFTVTNSSGFAFPHACAPVLQFYSGSAPNPNIVVQGLTPTSWDVYTSGTALTSSVTYKWTYVNIGN